VRLFSIGLVVLIKIQFMLKGYILGKKKNEVNEFEIFTYRIPWFQYPILYDIRARPSVIRSPTGSKGF
jgi:hypothetical protein